MFARRPRHLPPGAIAAYEESVRTALAAPRPGKTKGNAMPLTIEGVARVVHEANRAFQIGLGESNVSPHWEDASAEDRAASRAGVVDALRGGTPESSHEAWVAGKVASGWVYGPVKDAGADPPTHPCLVPYAELPVDQRAKDALLVAVVTASRPAMAEAILLPEPV